MGYIGADPALNESVATSQIADDAVTLAKMATAADGAIITYDTSGNPVVITGTNGQVATSAGADAVSAFEAVSVTGLTVADGGTGASTLTDGGILLGSGTGAITATAVLTNGQFLVGNGTTDPVAESGSTVRDSLDLGTGNTVQFGAFTLGSYGNFKEAGVERGTEILINEYSAGITMEQGALYFCTALADTAPASGTGFSFYVAFRNGANTTGLANIDASGGIFTLSTYNLRLQNVTNGTCTWSIYYYKMTAPS